LAELARASELVSVTVPDERDEAIRDLSRREWPVRRGFAAPSSAQGDVTATTAIAMEEFLDASNTSLFQQLNNLCFCFFGEEKREMWCLRSELLHKLAVSQ